MHSHFAGFVMQWLILFQVIDDFVTSIAETNITIISQEIFENDPRTRVENVKVNTIKAIIKIKPFVFKFTPLTTEPHTIATFFLPSNSLLFGRGHLSFKP